MGLKNLLRRASGLITAFALLASMMVVAGAAGVPVEYTCTQCGSTKSAMSAMIQTTSVKSVYGIDSIPSLGSKLYYLSNEPNKYFVIIEEDTVFNSSGTMICESCLEKIITKYKGTSVDSTTGAASVPVTVAREAATFSVTVPTTLPILVDADGNVTTATDAAINNNSGAPVAVTKVELASLSDWTLAAYSRDILNLPVDTRQFGLQMNIGDKTIATSNRGTSDVLSDSLNARIAKGQNCAVTYNALFPAQTAAVSDTQIANVVFTDGWA